MTISRQPFVLRALNVWSFFGGLRVGLLSAFVIGSPPIYLFSMGPCSSCGLDLPGCEKLCHECYLAQYAALTVPKDSSGYSWSAYMHLLLWISASYAFVTYTPPLAKAVVLGISLAVVWYLFSWAISQRPRKSHSTAPQRLSSSLGLCCAVVWKITGADVWGRLGIACILVSVGYTAAHRAIERAKATPR
jgi:hypothetical protein